MNDALHRPGFQAGSQKGVKIRYVTFEKCQGIEGKHHAKTESGVGRILLEDLNAPIRMAALDQERKQKTGRAGADDVNKHRKIGVLE